MHNNKTNPINKNISKEGIIYVLIFALFIVIITLVFVYAINFLRSTINTATNIPDNAEIENKYGQLDLENYLVVAGKLGLKKSTPIIPVIIETPVATTTSVSLPEIITPTSTPVTETPKVVEKRPSIIITNSTTKSGLASNLKNKLSTLGYQVLSTGNSRPSLTVTTIKVKNTVNPDLVYLTEIKKIVDVNYDFIVLKLDDTASSDIEIVIGNK